MHALYSHLTQGLVGEPPQICWLRQIVRAFHGLILDRWGLMGSLPVYETKCSTLNRSSHDPRGDNAAISFNTSAS